MREDYGTIWVCKCCMYTHANGGPCCEDDENAHKRARDERGRFIRGTVLGDSFPWASVDFRAGYSVAMGLAREEHSERCPVHPGHPEHDSDTECDCEMDTYSTSQCDGCGTWLHGPRHAFHLWRDIRDAKK